jgi:TonB-linked SusC/RagA family outer membrane protein
MLKLLIFNLLVVIYGTAGAQHIVQGTVTSKDDGQPIPGVNVLIQGTTSGTATDFDGKYSLQLGDNQNTLVFSFVGYTTQTITVGTQSVIDVQLASDTETLEEVVVVGYGIQRKSDLTGAVSSLKGQELTKVPALNPVQGLQGKVAGVQVTNTSGAPGANPMVRIRGVGTFNNSAPIYVVDGVILDDISFLNSSDIQSMEVLKDASATAIYGSRGANGVILITTKQGKIGETEPVINVSAEYSVQNLQKKIALLNGPEFANYVNQFAPGSYNNTSAVPNTDWQDQIFKPAAIQNYQVSASGSSAKSQYYLGVGYFKQDGIIDKSGYERVNIRFNNTFHITKKFRIGNNVTIAPFKQQNTDGGAVFNVYRAQPVVTPYRADGSYSPVNGVGNVLAAINYTNDYNKGIRGVGNVFTEVDFLKGFTFRSSFGVDFNYNKSTSYTPVFYVSPTQQNVLSTLNKGYNDRELWLWENTLTYKKEIGKSRFDLLGGYTMQNISSENLALVGQNLIRDSKDFWYLNKNNTIGTLTTDEVSDDSNYSMISYLFRANYTWNEKYLVTATFRRDGSSKFSSNNRYSNFPSIALGWNVINEDFMKALSVLSNFKVRASWGIIGNEKIAYNRRFSTVTNGLNAVFGQAEVFAPGLSYGVTGNPNLKWENTNQTDVGIEIGFFNDRLTLEADYYNRVTKDILIDLAVPLYLGNGNGSKITYNAGQVLNRGFEFNLGWKGEVKEFNYRIGLVGTTIHNETQKVNGIGGSSDYLFNGDQTTKTVIGKPIGSFYGYQTDGVFQNSAELAAYPHRSDAGVGDLRYADTNNDGVIDANDRTFLGSPIPTLIYGANFQLNYKNFDLSIDFNGQAGNKIYNYKETVRPDLYNFEKHYNNYWRGEGTSTSEPRPSSGGYNFLTSSRFIQNAAYFRLRNVTFGYNLPAKVVSSLKLKSARAFVRGTNVFTKTKYTGYSPEVASEDPLNNNIDRGTYPITAIYSVGINVSF